MTKRRTQTLKELEKMVRYLTIQKQNAKNLFLSKKIIVTIKHMLEEVPGSIQISAKQSLVQPPPESYPKLLHTKLNLEKLNNLRHVHEALLREYDVRRYAVEYSLLEAIKTEVLVKGQSSSSSIYFEFFHYSKIFQILPKNIGRIIQ